MKSGIESDPAVERTSVHPVQVQALCASSMRCSPIRIRSWQMSVSHYAAISPGTPTARHGPCCCT